MNLQSIRTLAREGVKSATRYIQVNSPTILSGLAVVGVITTVIFVHQDTLKAEEVLKQHEEELAEQDAKEQSIETTAKKLATKTKYVWKCYIPTAVSTAMTIVCIVGSNTVSTKRIAALSAAYSLSETALKTFQEKTEEVVGEKKLARIREEVAGDILTANPQTEANTIYTTHGDTWFYDSQSGRYFKSSTEHVLQTEAQLNMDLVSENEIQLNSLYYALGLPSIDLAEYFGWDISKGHRIKFRRDSKLMENGTPCCVLDYDVYYLY